MMWQVNAVIVFPDAQDCFQAEIDGSIGGIAHCKAL